MKPTSVIPAVLLLIFMSSMAQAETQTRGLVKIKDRQGQQVGLYQDSHALLIGVSDYTAGWPDLPGVRKDLKAVKKALQRHGFNVVVIKDPTRDQLQRAFRDFISRYGRQPDNRLLFYFAGHGHTERSAWGGEMGYIVPANAPNPHRNHNGFLDQAMDMEQIEVYAKRIQSKHALFLFDSCFSGSIFALSRAVPENISYKTARPVRQFLTSGSADEQVSDKSIFRDQFIEALNGEGDRNGDGYVTGVELGEFLQEKVINYSNGAQHPQYGKIRHPRLDKGDIVFVAGGSVVHQDQSTPSPSTGGLLIETRPDGGAVWLGGKRKGVAPLTLDGLKPGRVLLKATKSGHKPVEQRVRIRPGRRIPITLLLDREITTGSIGISSTPITAWYLDGDYMGHTPDKAQGIETGRHQIEVRKPGYKLWRRSVDIEQGNHLKLDARLEAEKIEYALAVETAPEDARVRILNIGPRYYSGIRLKPGRYHVEVSKKGYETHKQWVEIGATDRAVEVRLQHRSMSTAVSSSSGEWVDPVTGMEFVQVPGGCFQMGGNKHSDEKPVHEICVDGFWMGKYEVTQGRWKKIMGNNPSYFKKGDNHPVERVSWNDAQSFIKKLNTKGQGHFRLPTEAEWEYACRSGGKQEKYCGGNDVDRVAWYDKNSGSKTHPVGKKAGNGLGLYDMSGNVWEWVGDRYDKNYYRNSPKNNPQGPSAGAGRVDRGGGWDYGPASLRAADRYGDTPGDRDSNLGFRLLRAYP